VNFVALRETVLAEATFINPNNKSFWKKWIDSPQFNAILAALVIQAMDCLDGSYKLHVYISIIRMCFFRQWTSECQ